LPEDRVQALVAPFTGRQKVYGDIQKALESLEGEYRQRGFGTVQVYVPEQELTSGIVKIQVTEATVGKVEITGAQFHDVDNIRASIPQLQQGAAPNMRQLSENIQLANENPSKQLELTLGVADEGDKVNAKLTVTDEDPQRFTVTMDNTGTRMSGRHRIGLQYQHANVANLDQVATFNYQTALDAPSGVKVDIFSFGYRLPLYALGDSIDVIYANSSTNTPASVLTGSPFGMGVNGKGEVFALRYNHIFARQGEYSSRLIAGLDYKHINARCTFNGNPVLPFPGNPDPLMTASCIPYTLRPVSLTYSGQWQKPGQIIDFNVGGIYHAFPMGERYAHAQGLDRYSFVTSRPTNDQFAALRFGGSYMQAMESNWLLRAAFTGQHANNPLPAGEQIGLAGSTAVRGFAERGVSADRGYVANLEAYSPDYAGAMGIAGSFKFVGFLDWASGHNLRASGTLSHAVSSNIASVGLGFRYSLKKDVTAKLDVAHVLDNHQTAPGNLVDTKKGDFLGHLSVAVSF
jgi:hemolysin activation/secretion protein